MSSIKKRVWEKKQRDRIVPSSSNDIPTNFDYDNADSTWSCARKKAYTEEAFARRVARAMREERGAEVTVYACRHCGSFHIGRAMGVIR